MKSSYQILQFIKPTFGYYCLKNSYLAVSRKASEQLWLQLQS